MGITDIGLQTMATLLGSNVNKPSYTAIGAGSTAFDVSDNSLVSEGDRNTFTSTDFATSKEITYVTDFSSVELSGLTVSEHSVWNDSGLNIGSMFNREVLAGSLVFVGDRELQIQTTFRLARSGA